jgi:hypothetical protein
MHLTQHALAAIYACDVQTIRRWINVEKLPVCQPHEMWVRLQARHRMPSGTLAKGIDRIAEHFCEVVRGQRHAIPLDQILNDLEDTHALLGLSARNQPEEIREKIEAERKAMFPVLQRLGEIIESVSVPSDEESAFDTSSN